LFRRGRTFVAIVLAVTAAVAFSVPVSAAGSPSLWPSGAAGARANTEWRTSSYGGGIVTRRTLIKVFMNAGEQLMLGSSAVGQGTSDILVWNHVTNRRHELTSMGIRVTAETLKKQLELSRQLDFLKLPYHQAILNNEIPLSIGGGIGQSRTLMLLLRKAHLGEVSVTVWPKVLKEMCAKKNIFVLG